MIKASKQTSGRTYSLQQVSAETGVPQETLRVWEKELGIFAPEAQTRRYNAADLAAAHAMKRFFDINGATINDAQNLLAAAGPRALIAALGRTPSRPHAESPARLLQASIHKAAAAGLFGEVVAEVTSPARSTADRPVTSLDQARVARLMSANDSAARKRG